MEFNYNIHINTHYINIFIGIILLLFILFIIVSYFVLKILKSSLDEYNFFFYKYNQQSQKILDKYGDYKITKLYLVRQPFSKFLTLLLNILTCYQYNKLIAETNENFPYHMVVIFEVKTGKNMRKLVMVEKNNFVNISDNFLIHNTQEIKKINMKNTNYTIKSILTETQKRIGIEEFFNWHLYKNNCQEFTKEILISIEKCNNRNKKYIFRNRLFKYIFPSNFTLHIGYCLSFVYNLTRKYIYDSSIFNE
jgi:hypothetical protein